VKALGPIVFLLIIGGVAYLYLKSGATVGGSGVHGGDPGSVVNGGKGAVVNGWDRLRSDPHFWTFVGAGTLAALGVMTWRRIGGWGRGVVIVLATIALFTVFAK
jgi:hypothetical protein